MSQVHAQLALFGDQGEVIAAAMRTAQVVTTERKMRTYASSRRATKPAANDIPDLNTRLPDGVIDQGRWDMAERLQANLAALKALSSHATTHEGSLDVATRDCLARYVGWGGTAAALDDRNPNNRWRFEPIRDQIKGYLTDPTAWDALKASVLTAYYTPESLIDAVWAGVKRLGFTGGRVLEPAAGTGHFIGRRPADIQMEWTAIECEPVAASIAALLYPSAIVHAGRYEKTRLNNDSFDLAISNVPFGDYGVTDAAYTGGRFPSLRIHDYYFLKTIDKVRPGGLIAFITTHGTLDKTDDRVRRLIAQQADLLGAFRLPSNAFTDSANTQVVADVIFLRKRERSLEADNSAECGWIDTGMFVDGAHALEQNNWFASRPDAVLGARRIVSGPYGSALAVDADASRGYGALIDMLPEGVYIEPAAAIERQIAHERVHLSRDGMTGAQVGAFALDSKGTIAVVNENGELEPVKVSKSAGNRIALMIPVRDAAYRVVAVQVAGEGDGALHYAQNALHRAYDAMTKRYGPINKPANRRAISDDPALALLLSLEHFDDKTQTATKTALFFQRTIGAPEPVLAVDDPHDALAVCLNEHGRILPDRLCALLDQEWPAIRDALTGAIWREPESGEWQTASRYLSGNVVMKLEEAERAALSDASYQENVAALTAIQPEPLGAGEIDVNLGAPWVPSWVFHQFIGFLLGMPVHASAPGNAARPVHEHVPDGSVSFTSALGLWTAEIPLYRCDRSTFTAWGTSDFTPIALIEHGLNQKLPIVWKHTSDGNKIKDLDASNEAQEKLAAIKEAFAAWLWECPDRTAALCALYNRRFNCRVERQYDGSHLTFPGLSAARAMRAHQANFAWRVIEAGNTYAAHVVGSGKTGSMVCAAMESKRLGLARKPAVVVPNNLLYDFAAEAIRFYPAANVLIARKEDIAKEGRRRFIAKVCSQNWDLVVMTHESFGRIPMSDAYVERFIGDEIAEYEDMIAERKAADGDRITLKNLEQAKRRLETRLEKLTDQDARDHGGLHFEALGVDMLLVDEAHCFKNLEIKTRMGSVPGVTNAASQRALDLHMKTRWIMSQFADEQRGVVFASGTPISNSMTELYTNLKYLAPALCAEHDITHFDSWAAAFGEVVTGLERAPEGSGYRMNQRFANFVNVPELARIFREVADVKMAGDLDLPTPEAERHHHVCEPSDALRAYMKALGERAAACRNGGVDKTADNILKIANDGRHASLDMRLVDPAANDEPDNKARKVASTVVQHYEPGGDNVQLVFCDLATPKAHRFSVYTEIRGLLVDAGIPEAEIAFAQDYKTDAQRQAMYAAARAGQLRVVLGSTAKMGMGMNAQDRITDLHHVDAPWRPADIEQRDGRGIRQGNQNAVVRVHTYVTRDAYDEFMWETLKRKAGFIVQALTTPEKAQRRISDTIEPKYSEIMALASGDPRIREKVEIDDTVDRLSLRYRYHRNTQARIERRLQLVADEILDCRSRVDALGQDELTLTSDRCLTLANGQRVTGCDDIRLAVRAASDQSAANHRDGGYLGRMGGFDWHVAHARFDSRRGFALICRGSLIRAETVGRSAQDARAVMADLLDSLPQAASRTRARLESLQQEHTGLKAQQGQPFEGQAALDAAKARQREINRALTEAYETPEPRLAA